jgi:hypothetical protein
LDKIILSSSTSPSRQVGGLHPFVFMQHNHSFKFQNQTRISIVI